MDVEIAGDEETQEVIAILQDFAKEAEQTDLEHWVDYQKSPRTIALEREIRSGWELELLALNTTIYNRLEHKRFERNQRI